MEDFFKALGNPEPVFWYCGNGKDSKFTPRELPGKPDIGWAKAHPDGIGVYFAVNRLGDKRNDKGNLRHKDNVIEPLACFADFDDGTEEEQFAKICASPLTPSAIIRSGRGYHLYWFLEGDRDLVRWTRVQKAIARSFGSDEAISDPARLMRVPGSWHTKAVPRLVTLERCDPGSRFALDEISHAFPDSAKGGKDAGWGDLLSHITLEGGRNVASASFAGALLSRFKPFEWESRAWPLLQAFSSVYLDPILPQDELRSVFESIAASETAKRAVQAKGTPTYAPEEAEPQVRETDEGSRILFPVADGTAEFVFAEIEQTKSREIDATLVVRFHVPGSDPKPFSGRLNVLSMSAREGFARQLAKCFGKVTPWDLLLSRAAEELRMSLQSHDKSLGWGDITVPPEAEDLFSPYLVKDAPNVYFGLGGSGKTYIALRLALSLVTGEEFLGYKPGKKTNVMFLDYEDVAEEFKRRVTALCSGSFRPDMKDVESRLSYYPSGGVPLHDLVPALKRTVKERDIGVLMVDSAVLACANEPEKAETAVRMFNALSALGVTSLIIAHVTKLENNNFPFGSVFFWNSPRNIWNVQSEKDEGSKMMQVGLFHRKNNAGKLHKPIPVKLWFEEDDKGRLVSIDVGWGKMDLWETEMKTPSRILRFLAKKGGPAQFGEIRMDMEDESMETFRSALKRLVASGRVEFSGDKGGEYRLKNEQQNQKNAPQSKKSFIDIFSPEAPEIPF